MSWLAWLASLGPLVAFTLGCAVGWGWQKARGAHREATLQEGARRDAEQIRQLRETVGLLSDTQLTDAEFRRLLRQEDASA